jgi:hypothetical protein
VKTNKMQQSIIDRLRSELELLKNRNFEMSQIEIMQASNAGSAAASVSHGEKLKEVYEK